MRMKVMVVAAFLLAPAPVFANQDPVVTPPATEEAVQPEVAGQAAQAEQSAPARTTCRTIRRSESRLSTRRDRVCTPTPEPQPAEAAAPAQSGEGSTPAEAPVSPQ